MSIALNVDLRLVIEDGFLCIKVVDKGNYPWYNERVITESCLDLNDLKQAMESE